MDVETATARPRSPVSATVRVRGHDLVQDKPAALGGEDKGPMASEFLLAGLLACQLSTFRKVADKRRRPDVAAVEVRGDLHFKDGEVERIALHWQVRAPSAVKDQELETLLRLTDGACTVSRCMKVPISAVFQRV